MMESKEESRRHIIAELEQGSRDEIVWQKAMALTGGYEVNAKEKYIMLRIQQIERELRFEKQHPPKQDNHEIKDEVPESSPFPFKTAAAIILLLMFVIIFIMYQNTEADPLEQPQERLVAIEKKIPERNQSMEIDDGLQNYNDLVKLTIIPGPENAEVAIMNIRAKYRDGINLKKGKYEIRVSKPGYHTEKFWIDLDDDVEKKVTLSKERYRLYIECEPSDATIRIMNIKENFSDGMELSAGKYHAVVEKEGYETLETWIDLQKDMSSQKQLLRLKPIHFFGTQAMSFSQAYSTCLDKDLSLPSVEHLRKKIQLKEIESLDGKWFWSSEKSGVVMYKVVQNVKNMPIDSAKLSSKHFVYCVE